MDFSPPARTSSWKWQVCGLLLLATMINYMDRLTLNQTAKRVMTELDLDHAGYGKLEAVFSIAFAVGAVAAGWMVDRWNVWWLYPLAVLLWSLAGFATGFARTVTMLFVCRFFLGLMESGHWPCALRTTQRLLPPDQRTLGNSILQSGAAVGAIVTPLLVQYLLDVGYSWREPFLVVGSLGIAWVILWLVTVRPRDLAPAPPAATTVVAGHTSLSAILADRRFWILALLVACLNCPWHFFRAWLPLFLQEVHGYEEAEMNRFTTAYYISTDAGSLTAGFLALWLARKGMTVHASRLLVFLGCALLTTLSILTPVFSGPALLVIFLIIGFGALGLFPSYYSFTQELSVLHQGKVTGMLSFISWVSVAAMQTAVGEIVQRTHSYDLGLALAGFAPLLGFLALYFFWETRPTDESSVPSSAGTPSAEPSEGIVDLQRKQGIMGAAPRTSSEAVQDPHADR
jgi:ACS family hexuronate transporter-like MFS transporter